MWEQRSNAISRTAMNQSKIEQLERDIADLKARWPAHSVKPAMLQELEEMEATLEKALAEKDDGG